MRIIAKGTLKKYWTKHPNTEHALLDWYDAVKKYEWKSPHDIKKSFGNASIIGLNRVVFNIKGNDYRLVTAIDFQYQVLFILWIGSHKAYDKINVNTIEYEE